MFKKRRRGTSVENVQGVRVRLRVRTDYVVTDPARLRQALVERYGRNVVADHAAAVDLVTAAFLQVGDLLEQFEGDGVEFAGSTHIADEVQRTLWDDDEALFNLASEDDGTPSDLLFRNAEPS